MIPTTLLEKKNNKKKPQSKTITARIFSSFSEIFPVIPSFFSPYVCKIEERFFCSSGSLQKAFRLGIRPTGKPKREAELLQTFFSLVSRQLH